MATRHGGLYASSATERHNPITGEALPLRSSEHARQAAARSEHRDTLPFFVPKEPGQPAYQPPPRKPLQQSYENSLTRSPVQPDAESQLLRRQAQKKQVTSPISAGTHVTRPRIAPTVGVVALHCPPPFATSDLVLSVPLAERSEHSLRHEARQRRDGEIDRPFYHSTSSSIAREHALEKQLAEVKRALAGPATVTIDQSSKAMRALQRALQSAGSSAFNSQVASRTQSQGGTPRGERYQLHTSIADAAASKLRSAAALASPETLPAAGRPARAPAADGHASSTSALFSPKSFGSRYVLHGLASEVSLAHPSDFLDEDIGKSKQFKIQARIARAVAQNHRDNGEDEDDDNSMVSSRRTSVSHTPALQQNGRGHSQNGSRIVSRIPSRSASRSVSGSATPQHQFRVQTATEASAISSPASGFDLAAGADANLMQGRAGAWEGRPEVTASGQATPTTFSNAASSRRTSRGNSQPQSGTATPRSRNGGGGGGLYVRSGFATPNGDAVIAAAGSRSGAHTPSNPLSPSSARRTPAAGSRAPPSMLPRQAPPTLGTGALSPPWALHVPQTAATSATKRNGSSSHRSSRTASASASRSASGTSTPIRSSSQTALAQALSPTSFTPQHQEQNQSSSRPRSSPGSRSSSRGPSGATTPSRGTSSQSRNSSSSAALTASAARTAQVSELQAKLARLQTELKDIHSQAAASSNANNHATPTRAAAAAAAEGAVSLMLSSSQQLQSRPFSSLTSPVSRAATSAHESFSLSAQQSASRSHLVPAGTLLRGVLASEALGNTATRFAPAPLSPRQSVGGVRRAKERAASEADQREYSSTARDQADVNAVTKAGHAAGVPSERKSHRDGGSGGSGQGTSEPQAYSIYSPPSGGVRIVSGSGASSSQSSFASSSLASVQSSSAHESRVRGRALALPFVHPADERPLEQAQHIPFAHDAHFATSAQSIPQGGALIYDRYEPKTQKGPDRLGAGPVKEGQNQHAFHQQAQLEFAHPIVFADKPKRESKVQKLWKV